VAHVNDQGVRVRIRRHPNVHPDKRVELREKFSSGFVVLVERVLLWDAAHKYRTAVKKLCPAVTACNRAEPDRQQQGA
jgi:hypothetical protein